MQAFFSSGSFSLPFAKKLFLFLHITFLLTPKKKIATTVQRSPHDQVHAAFVSSQGEKGDFESIGMVVVVGDDERERKKEKKKTAARKKARPLHFPSLRREREKKKKLRSLSLTRSLSLPFSPLLSSPSPPTKPQGLYEQFRRVANLYFLLIAALSLTPVSPVSPVTNIVPLVLVIAASLAKEAFEDARRAKKDRQVRRKDKALL